MAKAGVEKLNAQIAELTAGNDRLERCLLAMRPPVKWMHQDHYHCKCGGIVEPFKATAASRAMPWQGVRRYGSCGACGRVMIETEYSGTKWPLFARLR